MIGFNSVVTVCIADGLGFGVAICWFLLGLLVCAGDCLVCCGLCW